MARSNKEEAEEEEKEYKRTNIEIVAKGVFLFLPMK